MRVSSLLAALALAVQSQALGEEPLVEAEHYTGILRSFLAFGLDSAPLERALYAARAHRWGGD